VELVVDSLTSSTGMYIIFHCIHKSSKSIISSRSKCLAVLDHMVRKKHKKPVSWVVGKQKAVNLLAPWTRWTSALQILVVIVRQWLFGDY